MRGKSIQYDMHRTKTIHLKVFHSIKTSVGIGDTMVNKVVRNRKHIPAEYGIWFSHHDIMLWLYTQWNVQIGVGGSGKKEFSGFVY